MENVLSTFFFGALMENKNQIKNDNKKAVIYCRVSSSSQEEEGMSLDSQMARCSEKAAELGYTVVDVIKDVHTGAELWERRGLERARTGIKEGKYNAFIVYAVDRLSRDVTHLYIVNEEVRRANAELVIVSEELDTTPQGKLMMSVHGFVAEMERQKIRERCIRGKRHRAEIGLIHRSGKDLYGYRRDKERGVRIEYTPESVIVRRIFQSIINGMSIRKVIAMLNNEPIPAPSASGDNARQFRDGRMPRWGQGTVRRILSETAYKGEAWAQRFKSGKKWGEIHSRPKSEWIRLPDETTPVIVEPHIWDAVQERLKNNRGDETRNEKRPDLLRGKIFCEKCGRKMRGQSERGDYRIYRCSSRETPFGACGSKRIPARICEEKVWEKIAMIFEQPEIITAEIERQRESGDNGLDFAASDVEFAKKEIRKIDQQIQTLVSRAANVDNELWKLFEKEINVKRAERARLEAIQADAEERLMAEQTLSAKVVEISDYCARVRNNLKNLSFEDKRKALDALGVQVFGEAKKWRLDISLPISKNNSVRNYAGVANTTSF